MLNHRQSDIGGGDTKSGHMNINVSKPVISFFGRAGWGERRGDDKNAELWLNRNKIDHGKHLPSDMNSAIPCHRRSSCIKRWKWSFFLRTACEWTKEEPIDWNRLKCENKKARKKISICIDLIWKELPPPANLQIISSDTTWECVQRLWKWEWYNESVIPWLIEHK